VSLKSLVSRDTDELNRSQLISAAVESAAENICDSFVAPLFYFLLFGVPGAIAYRVINTFDAMVGYHGHWEYLGKFAARLDDVANFIPARITALIIVLASPICRKNMSQAWDIMIRDHKKTESPNAGWTMGAIAGALGVQLEKAGHYKLGDNHSLLSLDTIDASRQVILVAAVIWCSIFILAEVIYLVAT
jgi:adenosylcobinamide-phosphate synthase